MPVETPPPPHHFRLYIMKDIGNENFHSQDIVHLEKKQSDYLLLLPKKTCDLVRTGAMDKPPEP